MPQTADWKTLAISSILLVGLCCPRAQAHSPVALAARTSKAATSEAEECLPHCRSDYTCIKGQCVSECNPPCSDNESCKQGECVAKTRATKTSSKASATASSSDEQPTAD